MTHNTVVFSNAKSYRIAVQVIAVAGNLHLQIGAATVQTITTTGSKVFTGQVPSTSGVLSFTMDPLETFEIDNVSVKEEL